MSLSEENSGFQLWLTGFKVW